MLDLVQRLKSCRERLGQIALRPNVMPSEEYLTLMIENENRNQTPGYLQRVRALELVKKRSELVKQIDDKGFDVLAGYKEDAHVKLGLGRIKGRQSRALESPETSGSWKSPETGGSWKSWFGF